MTRTTLFLIVFLPSMVCAQPAQPAGPIAILDSGVVSAGPIAILDSGGVSIDRESHTIRFQIPILPVYEYECIYPYDALNSTPPSQAVRFEKMLYDLQKMLYDLLGSETSPYRALIDGLSHHDWLVRKSAAIALGQFGPDAKKTVPFLVKSRSDENLQVQLCAERALEEISPDYKSELLRFCPKFLLD